MYDAKTAALQRRATMGCASGTPVAAAAGILVSGCKVVPAKDRTLDLIERRLMGVIERVAHASARAADIRRRQGGSWAENAEASGPAPCPEGMLPRLLDMIGVVDRRLAELHEHLGEIEVH